MGDVGPGPLSCVGLTKFTYNYEEVSLGVQSDFPRENPGDGSHFPNLSNSHACLPCPQNL